MIERLEQVVLRLCPDIAVAIAAKPIASLGELTIRRELVGCLLSSQVSYTSALRWTEAIASAGYFDDEWWIAKRRSKFDHRIESLLAGRSRHSRGMGAYRFASARAAQIARARDIAAERPWSARLQGCDSPQSMRRHLVEQVPGLGPKTSSMLLRNLGVSLDLAVLDRYVLRFMHLAGLSSSDCPPRSLEHYEFLESTFVQYAGALGYPAGCLDWAVWVTMRAAQELS